MSKHNTQHIPSQPEAPKQVPYLVANQGIIQNIDSILNQMKQPMYQNSDAQAKFRSDLKKQLKEALELTQKMLLLNRQGVPNGVKADPVGWTTADTDYDNPQTVNIYPHAVLVNKLLKELLKEQEQAALNEGIGVSEAQILSAQNDALDSTKSHIHLECIQDPETGITSKVEICKQTGDTQLYRKDEKTGLWHKVGNLLVGFWTNVKDFCKNIWGWVMKQYNRAKNWICNIFKSPEESQIIYKQAA